MRAFSLLNIASVFTRLAATLCLLLLAGCAIAPIDGPAQGHTVVFFPSYGARTAAGELRLTIQGRVYDANTARRDALVRALGLAVNAPYTEPLFIERAHLLVSDSSGNTVVTVKVGDSRMKLPPSDAAGYFAGELTVPAADVMQIASSRQLLAFQLVPVTAGGLVFSSEVLVLPEEGLTVITDMDDTIKDTRMLNPAERNANTFVRPFTAVEGMAALYRGWQAAAPAGIHFHLVSAGPWQLHEPLRRFTRDAGFPDFTWDMRSIDLPNLSILLEELQPNPQRTYEFKVRKISDFMLRFPRRHVVLVGDSGEMDPEVYATIVDRFPGRVDHVFIRNVRVEDQKDRYGRLFPAPATFAILRVFRDPHDLPPLR
jgi:phosphatidate phosphatase APP1